MRKFAHAHLLSVVLAKVSTPTSSPGTFPLFRLAPFLKNVQGKDLGTSLLRTLIRGSLSYVSTLNNISTERRHLRWIIEERCARQTKTHREVCTFRRKLISMDGRMSPFFVHPKRGGERKTVFRPTENSESFNLFDHSHIPITTLFPTTFNNKFNKKKYFLKKERKEIKILIPTEGIYS